MLTLTGCGSDDSDGITFAEAGDSGDTTGSAPGASGTPDAGAGGETDSPGTGASSDPALTVYLYLQAIAGEDYSSACTFERGTYAHTDGDPAAVQVELDDCVADFTEDFSEDPDELATIQSLAGLDVTDYELIPDSSSGEPQVFLGEDITTEGDLNFYELTLLESSDDPEANPGAYYIS